MSILDRVPLTTIEDVVAAADAWAAQYREEQAALEAIPDSDLMRNGSFDEKRDTPEWERFRVAVRRRHVVHEALLEAVDALPVAEPLPRYGGTPTVTLDEAWKEAEAALPNLWRIEYIEWASPGYRAAASGFGDWLYGSGPTPVVALQALTLKLRSGSTESSGA